jgi:transcription elongation factor Elf1
MFREDPRYPDADWMQLATCLRCGHEDEVLVSYWKRNSRGWAICEQCGENFEVELDEPDHEWVLDARLDALNDQ